MDAELPLRVMGGTRAGHRAAAVAALLAPALLLSACGDGSSSTSARSSSSPSVGSEHRRPERRPVVDGRPWATTRSIGPVRSGHRSRPRTSSCCGSRRSAPGWCAGSGTCAASPGSSSSAGPRPASRTTRSTSPRSTPRRTATSRSAGWRRSSPSGTGSPAARWRCARGSASRSRRRASCGSVPAPTHPRCTSVPTRRRCRRSTPWSTRAGSRPSGWCRATPC